MKLLTTREAAELLRVSTRTVHRLCLTRELKAFRVGHQWRIDADALAANASQLRPADSKPTR